MYYNYNYGAEGTLVGFLLASAAVFAIIGLVIAILMIVAMWKILEKGEQPGWASLVPIYREYVLCKMIGINPWWILVCFLSGLVSFIPLINLISIAAGIYFTVLLNVSLARAFGKEDTFAIGLIIFPVIFYPILAFGKNDYIGAKPMNDVIFKKGEEFVNNSSNSSTKATKYCANCGTGIDNDTKYCPNCGNEIK